MYFHRVIVAVALCLLVAGLAMAQVSSTRVSGFDWRCEDANGKVIGINHQRFDTAFVACLNSPDGVYLQGGRYRLTKSAPAPTPTPGTASLNWTPPTQNVDGTSLSNLAGYRISYGTSATALAQTVQVPAVSTYTVTGLAPGTYYFAVRAYTSGGTESASSNVVSKVIL